MLALLTPQTAWLIVAMIAVATVLLSLRALATVIRRETLIHDLKVEAQRKRLSAPGHTRE